LIRSKSLQNHNVKNTVTFHDTWEPRD
jgi:hypothetical protein